MHSSMGLSAPPAYAAFVSPTPSMLTVTNFLWYNIALVKLLSNRRPTDLMSRRHHCNHPAALHLPSRRRPPALCQWYLPPSTSAAVLHPVLPQLGVAVLHAMRRYPLQSSVTTDVFIMPLPPPSSPVPGATAPHFSHRLALLTACSICRGVSLWRPDLSCLVRLSPHLWRLDLSCLVRLSPHLSRLLRVSLWMPGSINLQLYRSPLPQLPTQHRRSPLPPSPTQRYHRSNHLCLLCSLLPVLDLSYPSLSLQ